MIKKIILFILISFCFSFYIKKNKSFIPPGTARITETFFADEAEISNLSWREYEQWVKTKYGANSKEHIATLPDTLVWRNPETHNEPYVIHYYKHPAYKNYPVVGISYEQALAFCKWRTERVKEYYSIATKKDVILEYQLPNKEQWEFLSNNAPGIFSNKGKDRNGKPLVNCYRETDPVGMISISSPDVIAPISSYDKNYFGLYNTIGNVSEMILEKGICKGGSWHHTLEDCRAGKDVSYTKPESWLGFRCVCIVRQPS